MNGQEPRTTPGTAPKTGVWQVAVIVAVGAVLILVLAAPLLWPESHGVLEQLVAGSAAGRNVLVITLDTTRADRLGCYGDSTAETPALDALAAEGIRFDDAVAPVPVTLPSHATIFTGLDPPNHGVRNNGEFILDAKYETLAEVLGNEGYETAAFVSAFVLDTRFGLNQGFEIYDDRVDLASAVPTGPLTRPIYERAGGQTTAAAVRWLVDRDKSRPFFSWVHYFDPHDPYRPPPAFARRFHGRLYEGEIAYMDTQIGELLKAVKAHAGWHNTLVIVVGDHGEGLGDHNETTHAHLIYDTTMRVPLVMTCPGLFRGPYVVDDVVVSIADIFPTVLDLLAIEHNKPLDGRSLLAADADRNRVVYIETLAPYFDNGWAPLHGLRRHHDKYILAPRPEYYDLRSDPGELKNLYAGASGAVLAGRDALASELSFRLAEWPSLEGVLGAAQTLDPEARRKLESLGYVGSITERDPGDELPDPKDMMPVQHRLDRSDVLSAGGKFTEALAVLHEAAALAPNNPMVMLYLGNVYLQMGRDAQAEEAFYSAVGHSSDPRVPVVGGQVLLKLDRPDKAAEFLETCRKSEPDNVDLLINLAVAYMRTGRTEQAHELLLHAEQLSETHSETYINLATCGRLLGRPADALVYADKAVALAPEIAETHHARGLALIQLGQDDAALESLASTVQIDSRNPRFLQDIANLCVRLRRFPEAISHFEALATLLPTQWEPQAGLAQIYLHLRRFDEAEAAISAGLQLAPDQPPLLALARRLSELRSQPSIGGD